MRPNASVPHSLTGQPATPGGIGVVVIGRNEGERLKRCLVSLRRQADRTLYVDSGSSDGSIALSRQLGVRALELDLRFPFTAARARNAGATQLLSLHPDLSYVFFVDGDCEVVPGWLDKARSFLDAHPDVALVFGRRREQYPERSIYNLLCDIEWDTPIGAAQACGGDAVVRWCAFQQVQGFRSELICGEEPELCVRLRRQGWLIWRLDEEMTRHDAALLRFGQWWRRMLRGGYGFAVGAALHGATPERHWVKESQRVWLWGLLIPIAVALLTITVGRAGLLLLLIYPLQVVSLALRGQRSARENWWRAVALVVGKFPEVLGQMKFMLDRHRRVQSRLIEYK